MCLMDINGSLLQPVTKAMFVKDYFAMRPSNDQSFETSF